MKKKPLPSSPIPATPQYWLLATTALTIFPHIFYQPVWLSILAGILIILRFVLLRTGNQQIPAPLIILTGLCAAIGVRVHFGYFFAQDSGVALLLVLMCLKQMEIRTTRDIRVTIALSYFLQLGLFFYDQSPLTALQALTGALLSTSTLLSLLPGSSPGLRRNLKTSALLLLQGLPFMITLFLLFPRGGPLWGTPHPSTDSQTGLPETMEPGKINNLAQSSGIAFRVNFHGNTPPMNLRYWRGPVLSRFDGTTWRQGVMNSREHPAYQPSGQSYSYEMILEPHNKTWLLAMDYPGDGIQETLYSSNFQLIALRPVHTKLFLTLSAYPASQVGLNESGWIRRGNTRLPENSNPRTRTMVASLLQDSTDDADKIRRLEDFMRSLPLVYTLQPPLTGPHSVDDFLFRTHSGFCEHFASAFAFMARLAGIPARVVIGYQGGEFNPIDGTLTIRQREAHAWNELWLEGKGWIRFDPTAIAAPERINGEVLGESLSSTLQKSWVRELVFRWEALSNYWNRWVLGYDQESQASLFERLGLSKPDWKKLLIILAALCFILALLLFWWALHQRPPMDRLDILWAKFCKKTARHGLPRYCWEGPAAYGQRLVKTFPQQKKHIEHIIQSYSILRYGPDPAERKHRLEQLNRTIRTLRLR